VDVDILFLVLGLVFLEAVEEISEAHLDLMAVVQETVRNGSSVDTKEAEVDDKIGCTEVGRRVSLVLDWIEDTPRINGA